MANASGSAEPAKKKAKIADNCGRVTLKNEVLTMIIHWYHLNANRAAIDHSDLFTQETLVAHMFNALKHVRQELNNTGDAAKDKHIWLRLLSLARKRSKKKGRIR